MAAIEARFEPVFRAELSREYAKLIDDYEAGRALSYDPEHERALGETLDEMATVAVKTFGARVIGQGIEKGFAYTRGDGGFGFTNPYSPYFTETKDFAATLAQLARRYIGLEAFRRKITSIAETTRAQIIAVVQRGETEGLGVAQIARVMRDVVPSLSSYRSNLIARTETHGAANYGANGAAKETGLTIRKEWVAASDARTRDSHARIDGETVGMDDAFSNGLMYPGDPSGPPEEVINCRCAVSHVVID